MDGKYSKYKRYFKKGNNSISRKKNLIDINRYKYWKKYFNESDEIPDNINEIYEKCKIYLKNEKINICSIMKTGIMELDYMKLLENEELCNFLDFQPLTFLNLFSMILNEIIIEYGKVIKDDFLIKIKIINHSKLISLSNLKSQYLNRFISTRGTVSLVEKVEIVPISMKFSCKRCGDIQLHILKDDIFSFPTKCLSEECTSKLFDPIKNDLKCIEKQKIIINEIETGEIISRGKAHGNLMCLLRGDLVDKCSPGDEIFVSGILSNIKKDTNFSSNSKLLFTLYIDANSLSNNQIIHTKPLINNSQHVLSQISVPFCISDDNEYFYRLICSFCPKIYGNLTLKAALLLSLVSGTNETSSKFIRKNAHLLMIGEPGLGKSQLLKAVHNVAPKSVYICGSASSSAGLTLSLNRDSGGNEFSIDPGAVVLANHGVCCIDEFDKIPQHHDSLLEVMEQQCVSLAKSGTLCNMQAQTTIIAAANFNEGSYAKRKSFTQNTNFGESLLSRFDFIFLLIDTNNERYNLKLADHLMNSRMNKLNYNRSQYFQCCDNNFESKIETYSKCLNKYLDTQDIKQIIWYSRSNNINPKLNENAKKLIKEYYIKMRKTRVEKSLTPVTIRQLESLIRLSEARAKADLREEITENDVIEIIDIFEKR